MKKIFQSGAVWLGAGGMMLLSGCHEMDLLDPKGSVGVAEKHLILTAAGAMLIVVIPVIVLTLFFAWRYRETNTRATYAPKWAHSTPIEIVVWGIPIILIGWLGVLTWKTTHELDPYRPLVSDAKPIEVEVVALDWKWLFIYPQYGIASVNQLTIPVGTPVSFRVTSDSVMNSFFIPRLGTQVYAMAGMQTRVHLIADHIGDYAGISANYSGRGFSDMKFRTEAVPSAQFDTWVAQVRSGNSKLDAGSYDILSRPNDKALPPIYFSSVDPQLFHDLIAKYNNGHVLHLDGASCTVTKG